MLQTGIIAGNRNADNIDEKLKDFKYLLYPSRSIKTTGIRAALLKSFGFGQVGGEVLVIHPDCLINALDRKTFDEYTSLRAKRYEKTFRFMHDSLIGSPLVRVKDLPPYEKELESRVYLNPCARASLDPVSGTYSIKEADLTKGEREGLIDSLGIASKMIESKGIGVDVQLISEIGESEHFISRNFTEGEIAYCCSKADSKSSYAGRWAAKEAIFKALCNAEASGICPAWLKGEGASLKPIEIKPSNTGAPLVFINGVVRNDIKVIISHSGAYAVAIAQII